MIVPRRYVVGETEHDEQPAITGYLDRWTGETRRTYGFTLYLDRAGLGLKNTRRRLTDKIGFAPDWTALHWMAKGAGPLERGGRLWARDEARGFVLFMADMKLENPPS